MIPDVLKHRDKLVYLQLGTYCLAFLFITSWRFWALMLISVFTACVHVSTKSSGKKK